MDKHGHFKVFIISLIILMMVQGILASSGIYLFQNVFFTDFSLIVTFYLLNPDLDLAINGSHRWLVSHSCIPALALYMIFRPFVENFNGIWLLAFILFFPLIIHLLADFKFTTVIGAITGDAIEKLKHDKIKAGNSKTVGTWRISFYPIRKKMSFYQSILWISSNILFMIGFTVYLYILHGN